MLENQSGKAMKKVLIGFLVVILIGAGIAGALLLRHQSVNERKPEEPVGDQIKLPEPRYDSDTSVEQALLKRRSARAYKDEPQTLAEVSQLLWAAQGITDPQRGFRTAPSAGALYPLEVYVVIENVKGVEKGVYKYTPHEHGLNGVRKGSTRDELMKAALGQTSVGEGAIVVVIAAVYERTTQKYGERGIRYVHMEAGHAAQNVYLQAVSLNLGTVVIGAFEDEAVQKVLNMQEEEHPLYIMPVGRMTK